LTIEEANEVALICGFDGWDDPDFVVLMDDMGYFVDEFAETE
jgi:hypothetical protein